MSNPTVATEQLLELLLTLKKTTPQAARSILNAQPAIAYALITLMVSMNAISIEVFQRTVAEFGAGAGSTIPDASSSITTSIPSSIPMLPSAAPAPISAVPPHLQAQYRVGTPPTAVNSTPPPTHTPTPPYGYSHPPAAAHSNGAYGGYNGYPTGYPAATPAAPLPSAQPSVSSLPEALANIPSEQKALILRVVTMTPDQIKILPPAERATFIQIRTTLGIPTE